MADLSKIKLNGVEYNIKDATARALAQPSNWEAESEEAGYIDNKPNVRAGTGTGAIIANSISGKTTNIASGNYSYAEGSGTKARATGSHAEGSGTTASGLNSHAEGTDTTASGVSSHAEGGGTTASGYYSHAEGTGTSATKRS